MDVAKRVMDLRNEAGLSKGELARRAGLAESYIGQIESKKKHPTVDTIFRICSGLDITIQEFFSIEQDLSALPPDLHKFVTKKENRDMLRFISEMKEKGHSGEMIVEWLRSLKATTDIIKQKYMDPVFLNTGIDKEAMSAYHEKKNKKS